MLQVREIVNWVAVGAVSMQRCRWSGGRDEGSTPFRAGWKSKQVRQVDDMRTKAMTGFAAVLFMAAGCGQGTPEAGNAQQAETRPVSATWSLDTEGSSIAFVSIKSGELIESHTFTGLSGQISPDGEAEIDIPLDKVETKIDLRNERMRDMFFETGTYPVATVNASVDPEAFADLPIGGRTRAEITGELSLHGVEAPVYADVFVTRIGDSRIEVASAEPVVVSVAEFDLDNGLERLREVAGLPSITPASPVTFTFVFEAEDE